MQTTIVRTVVIVASLFICWLVQEWGVKGDQITGTIPSKIYSSLSVYSSSNGPDVLRMEVI